MWVAEHESALFARVAKVLLPKAYVRWRLCGEWHAKRHGVVVSAGQAELQPALVEDRARRLRKGLGTCVCHGEVSVDVERARDDLLKKHQTCHAAAAPHGATNP